MGGFLPVWSLWREELLFHRRLRPATVLNYRYALQDWFQHLDRAGRDWRRVNARDLDRYLSRPVHQRGRGVADRPLSPTSRAWYSTVLLNFYTDAVRMKLIKRNPLEGVRPEKRPSAIHRALSIAQVALLFASITDDDRAYACVALAYFAGLRVGEIARLMIQDVDLDRRTMVVHGKGGHVDQVPVKRTLATILAAFLAGRPRTGPVIEHRQWPGRPVSAWTVSQEISGAMHAAGIKESAHALRHSFATHLLVELEGNIFPVAQLMRHKSLASIQIYVKFDEQLAKFVERLPDPRAERSTR